MFNKWDIWRYSDNNNCWDFVRSFLLSNTDIPKDDLPEFGILPSDKRSMTKAAKKLERYYVKCDPVDYSIACHFHGGILHHVGVVDGGFVRHTSKDCGTKKITVREFESLAQKTEYRIHNSLWPN